MPDASIKGIEFTVQGSTNGASKSIDRLVGKMAKLQSVLGNTKSANGYSRSMQSISKATSKTLSKFSKALIATPIKALTDRVKSATGALSKLGAAFKRIVFYRFIRSVIREIGDAFKYGVNNLYAWSQAADGRFAASMDRIATAFAYFKNSIGAAVAPLINALAPAIDYVIDKAVALLNVINQLFARLTGATYWTKAIKQANAYGDAASSAGGAAKEALRYLAPFDELNVLPSDNGSGGGGGGGGSSGGGLFEIQQDFSESVSNFAQMVKDAWDSGEWDKVGQFLGNKINDLINNKIKWKELGETTGRLINALFGTTYWTLDTVNFTNLGNKIAEFVNNAISNIDWNIAGRLSVKQFTVILDTIIGFIEGLDWDSVASSISEFVGGAISEFDGWMDDQDWSGLGTTIGSGINKILTETPWEDFIPSMVTFATDILTTINSAISQIHWGPWNEDGTLLNKLYNGLKNADWYGLWEQAKQMISNTWPIWTFALAINLLPTIGSIVGTITKTAILNAVFGGGATAAAGATAASGISLAAAGIAIEIPLLIKFAATFKNVANSEGYQNHEFGSAPFLSNYDIVDLFTNPVGWADAKIAAAEQAMSRLGQKLNTEFNLGRQIEPTTSDPNMQNAEVWMAQNPGSTLEDYNNYMSQLNPDLMVTIPVTAQVTKVDDSKLSDDQKTIPKMNAGIERRTLSQGVLSPIEGLTAGFGARKVDSIITKDPVTGFTAGLSKWTPNFSSTPSVDADTYGKYFYRDFTKYPWVYADTYGRYFYRDFTKYPWVYADTYGKYFYRSFDTYPYVYADTYGKYFYRSFDSYPWVYADTYGKYWHSAFSSTPWVDAGASFYTYSRDWSGAPWVSVSASVMSLGGSLTTSRTTVGAIANPTGFASGGVMTKRFWKSLPKYAQGTRDAHGSLFVAGEAGPEVLGHIGGRTEVLNQSQLASTMYAAVKNAMSGIRFKVSGEAQTYDATPNNEDNMVRAIITALQTLGLTGDALDNVQAHISSQEVYDSVRESNNRNTRMTGVNAFA